MVLLHSLGAENYLMVKINKGKVADSKRKRAAFLLFISILIIIYAAVSFVTGNTGLSTIIEMQRTKKTFINEIARLEEENRKLAKEIKSLKENPEYIETIARERLGLVKKGETVYRFVE